MSQTEPPISGAGDADRTSKVGSADRHDQIGPYHLLGKLGAGGMGEVYKAERRQPIRQIVAIKVIKLGFDTREVIARFESERQALARMDHPSVARVLDAGTTELGRPYFVMEYVPGSPITQFCDDNRLSIADRLKLFIQACEAINHAHTKAIIHRDIKASNVLAYLLDGRPTVKVIDFGIAKALTGDRLTDATFNTDAGMMVGTFDSMSPEQADGSPDIDTRTDVYALGSLLYELLAGVRPFDHATLARADHDERRRIIRQVEPPRPSTRLSSLGQAQEVAAARQARLDHLTRDLRGELEWIPLKALRKERARRYASPLQIAEDIQNYLDGKPLMAGPESKVYRTNKFIRRHRASLALTTAILVSALGGVSLYIRNIRAEQARTRAALTLAQSRFDDVRQLASTFLFDVHDKIESLAGATPARALLVDTALEYLSKLSAQAGDDPTLLREIATAYERVGDVQGNPNYSNLGKTAAALESYRKSLTIRQKLAASSPSSADAERDLAMAHLKIGEMLEGGDGKDALASYRTFLTIAQKLADADPIDTDAQRNLAMGHEKIGEVLAEAGNTPGALDSYRLALGIRRKLSSATPDDDDIQRDVLLSFSRVGDLLQSLGKSGEALKCYRTGLSIGRKLAEKNPTSAGAQRDLAVSHRQVGDALSGTRDLDGALDSYRTSLSIFQRLADADANDANAQRDLWNALSKMGEVFEATGATISDPVAQRIEAWREARSWYERSAEQYRRLQRQNILSSSDAKLADEVAGNPARCDAAIATLQHAATTDPTTTPARNEPSTTRGSAVSGRTGSE